MDGKKSSTHFAPRPNSKPLAQNSPKYLLQLCLCLSMRLAPNSFSVDMSTVWVGCVMSQAKKPNGTPESCAAGARMLKLSRISFDLAL
jgi:hypothetical protein